MLLAPADGGEMQQLLLPVDFLIETNSQTTATVSTGRFCIPVSLCME